MNRIDTLPPEIELAQLLQRCAAQDSAAFRTLYDKTSPILFARLLRMLRRRSVAEEALQDVYVRIWQRAAQFEAASRPRARLDGDHRALLRHRPHAPRAHDAGLRRCAGRDSPTSPPRKPGGIEKPNNFDHCIGQLNDNTRKCLTLAFVEGRSHDEIARLTTNPLGSVKSWIRRGLLALKECLSSERQAT